MLELLMITKARVLKHFKTVPAVAAFFGITDKAVYQWKDGPIPRERELELMLRLPSDFGLSGESADVTLTASTLSQ